MRRGLIVAVLMEAKCAFTEREGLAVIHNMSKPVTILGAFLLILCCNYIRPPHPLNSDQSEGTVPWAVQVYATRPYTGSESLCLGATTSCFQAMPQLDLSCMRGWPGPFG